MDFTSHPLLQKCHDLCVAIERCGASPELTQATVLGNELMRDIAAHLHQEAPEAEAA